ncbi:hypothetical protein [Methanothermobacter sp.]|uniref:hypothetical protein n=1 Tax=Methanothermobacter sp. TaxID=1884223 RepID=UPI00261DF846|nr:hypothetical protein [Methanothermobacter sp.]MDI9615691.1 hypothetical protein [Methanothermobacter sp.]
MIELLFPVSGFLMKVADDAEDEWGRPLTGMVAGALCGLSSGVLSTADTAAACIFLGIFAGTLLSCKIDCPSHVLAAAVFFLVLFFGEVPPLSIPALVACTAGAYIDEYGNDNPGVYEKGRFFRFFFDYRFSLKAVIVLLAVISLLEVSDTGFGPATVLFFILFEVAYEIAGTIRI